MSQFSALTLAAQESDPLSIKLVLLSPEVKLNQNLILGLDISIKEGWHTYWKFPGAAGLATRLINSAGQPVSLEFPLPKRFIQPGDIVGYGYESSALLKFEQPAITDSADLSFTVRYLGCSSVCVPGKVVVHRKLTIGDKWNESESLLDQQWKDRFVQKKTQQLKASSSSGESKQYLLPAKLSGQTQVFVVPGEQGAFIEPGLKQDSDQLELTVSDKVFGNSNSIEIVVEALANPKQSFQQILLKN